MKKLFYILLVPALLFGQRSQRIGNVNDTTKVSVLRFDDDTEMKTASATVGDSTVTGKKLATATWTEIKSIASDSSTEYTADETTLDLTSTEFGVKDGGIDAAQIATDAVTYAKIDTGAAGFVDVRKFGVVGDGVTDNAADLQTAIDYAIANSEPIFIPAGDYRFGTTLTITGAVNITIRGAGKEQAILYYTGSANALEIGDNNVSGIVSGVNLDDFTLRGSDGSDSENNGISLSWANNINITNCTISYFGGAGIINTAASYMNRLRNVNLTYNTIGFQSGPECNLWDFSAVYFWHSDSCGVILKSSSGGNLTFTNCLFENNGDKGFYAHEDGTMTNVSLRECWFEANVGDYDVQFSATGGGGYGRIVVDNCYFNVSGKYAIALNKGTKIRITNCRAISADSAFVYLPSLTNFSGTIRECTTLEDGDALPLVRLGIQNIYDNIFSYRVEETRFSSDVIKFRTTGGDSVQLGPYDNTYLGLKIKASDASGYGVVSLGKTFVGPYNATVNQNADLTIGKAAYFRFTADTDSAGMASTASKFNFTSYGNAYYDALYGSRHYFQVDGTTKLEVEPSQVTMYDQLYCEADDDETTLYNRAGDICLKNKNATDQSYFLIENKNSDNVINAGIAFQNLNTTQDRGRVYFGVRGSSSWYPNTLVLDEGRVGIQKTNPAVAFDVVGSAAISGTLIANTLSGDLDASNLIAGSLDTTAADTASWGKFVRDHQTAGAGSGDIDGVTAGDMLTGGGESGTVTVNVDTTAGNVATKYDNSLKLDKSAAGDSADTAIAAITWSGDLTGTGTSPELAANSVAEAEINWGGVDSDSLTEAVRDAKIYQSKTFTFLQPDSVREVVTDSLVFFSFDDLAYPNGAKLGKVRITTSAAVTDTIALYEYSTRAGASIAVIDSFFFSSQQDAESLAVDLDDSDMAADSWLCLDLSMWDATCKTLEVTIIYYIKAGD